MKHTYTLVSFHFMNMYFECDDHIEARKVFDKMSARYFSIWNNVLSGYVKVSMIDVSWKLFAKIVAKMLFL